MSNSRPNGNGDDLLNFIAATVETMHDQIATMRDQMVTMRDQMATMHDQMATKSDIARLEDKIGVETAAIRGDIEQVQLRLDSIERGLNSRLSQVEADMSRMRSVLYLLVKDKPDMLRLLGQTPPAQ